MKPRSSQRARLLAASFVVTAASGCVATTSQDPQPMPTSNPPAPTTTTATQPPPPTPPPPSTGTPSTPASSHIEKRPDGTCVEIANTHCPPGATCNPPPPKKVTCPTTM